jgi:hypothetical protein
LRRRDPHPEPRDSRSGGASRNTAGRSRGIVNARANTAALLRGTGSLPTRHGNALNCPGRDEPITGVMSNSPIPGKAAQAQDVGAASIQHSPASFDSRTRTRQNRRNKTGDAMTKKLSLAAAIFIGAVFIAVSQTGTSAVSDAPNEALTAWDHQDIPAMNKSLEKEAKSGNASARETLDFFQSTSYDSTSTDQQKAEAFSRALSLAKKGNTIAQTILADMYTVGLGTGDREKEAIHYLSLAAQKHPGGAFAEGALAKMYAASSNADDAPKALHNLSQAALHGYPPAITALAYYNQQFAGKAPKDGENVTAYTTRCANKLYSSDTFATRAICLTLYNSGSDLIEQGMQKGEQDFLKAHKM